MSLVQSNSRIICYLIVSISGKSQFVSENFFFHVGGQQGKVTPEATTFGWVWPVVPLIQSDVGFSDHPYLRKKSINIIYF